MSLIFRSGLAKTRSLGAIGLASIIVLGWLAASVPAFAHDDDEGENHGEGHHYRRYHHRGPVVLQPGYIYGAPGVVYIQPQPYYVVPPPPVLVAPPEPVFSVPYLNFTFPIYVR